MSEFRAPTPVFIGQGGEAALNITAAAVVKLGPSRVARVSVVVAGSAAGAVHDCAATGDVAAGNKIASIPNTVGVYTLDWPCAAGVAVVPGSGQTLAVSYS